MLLTPYLANTGLIAEVDRAGGLQPLGRTEPRPTTNRTQRFCDGWQRRRRRAAPDAGRTRLGDRFVATATMLADLTGRPRDQRARRAMTGQAGARCGA